MKRYLLFGGDFCYPLGGFDDLIAESDILSILTSKIIEKKKDSSPDIKYLFKRRKIEIELDWYHIIDIRSMNVAASSGEKLETDNKIKQVMSL